jgi:hypothetical protein
MNYTATRRCSACRTPIPAVEPAWKLLCRECFVTSKKREHAELLDEVGELHLQIADLRAEVAVLRSQQRSAIEPAMVRVLLQLAHPDRHGNSAAANKATQCFLSLKRERATA